MALSKQGSAHAGHVHAHHLESASAIRTMQKPICLVQCFRSRRSHSFDRRLLVRSHSVYVEILYEPAAEMLACWSASERR